MAFVKHMYLTHVSIVSLYLIKILPLPIVYSILNRLVVLKSKWTNMWLC